MDRRIADMRKGGGRGGELMRGVVLMIGSVQCAGLLFGFFLLAERRIYLCRGDSARGVYTPVIPQVPTHFQSWFSPRILQGISIEMVTWHQQGRLWDWSGCGGGLQGG